MRLLICLFLFLSQHTHLKAETWLFATFEAPPHTCRDCPGKGLLITFIKEKLAKRGIQAEFVFYPYLRAQREGATAKFVGYFPEWPSDLPHNKYFSSQVIFASPVVVVTRKEFPLPWKKLEDLKGNIFGVVNGYTYGQKFTAMARAGLVKLDPVHDEATNLRKLAAGRLNATIIDANNAVAIMQQNRIPKNSLEIQSKVISYTPNIIGINRKHPDVLRVKKIFKEEIIKEELEAFRQTYIREHF